MPTQIVECVPNFSEGRDQAKIKDITDALQSVADVDLLDVDPGRDTNRTVVTFIGPPEAVAEAAFRAIAKAAQVIDMRGQHGSHPRMGATDVCPFVPVEGVTMEDCAELARRVGRRVGEELGIPVYLYEAAAAIPQRRNLADIRQGEYEGLAEKLRDPRWKPDFGPAVFNPQSGATAIGAREFLIAYNITLNTRDQRAATDIAFELREKGRAARSKTASPYYHAGELLYYSDGRYPCGNCDFMGATFAETEAHCRASHGYEVRELAELSNGAGFAGPGPGPRVRRAGKFKFCKAIGWYAAAFQRAQISINLTNYRVTPPHLVLEEARQLAADRGLVVTGSEVVGMIPFAALLQAGQYYLARQGRSPHVPIADVLETAVFSMGLNDVQPFDVSKKVIGMKHAAKGMAGLAVRDFVDEVSRDTPAPGGGSVAALAGSLGAALAAMVANITHARAGGDAEKQQKLLAIAEKAQALKVRLLDAVVADSEAFNAYLAALRMTASTPDEKELRERKVQAALRHAAEVPYETALAGYEAMQAAQDAARAGLAASITDAGVGCEIACVAVRGGVWNALVNLKDIQDCEFAAAMRTKCEALLKNSKALREANEREIDQKLRAGS
jgi:glutamate formiminotransferase / formiminotetrahydrofolate cyclodeaminase